MIASAPFMFSEQSAITRQERGISNHGCLFRNMNTRV